MKFACRAFSNSSWMYGEIEQIIIKRKRNKLLLIVDIQSKNEIYIRHTTEILKFLLIFQIISTNDLKYSIRALLPMIEMWGGV